MKKFLVFIFSFGVGFVLLVPAHAQTNGELSPTYHTSGITSSSMLLKDPRLDLLIQKQIYLNMLALRNMPGYRIQVMSTIDRSKAMDAKARLMQLFPDYQTYLSYQSPYFRVRIGDFRDKNKAGELQQELNEYFPNGVFTVRDYIHISPEQLFQTNNDEPDDSTH